MSNEKQYIITHPTLGYFCGYVSLKQRWGGKEELAHKYNWLTAQDVKQDLGERVEIVEIAHAN